MPDWSELPPELIERIAKTLDSIPDYIIFGAVCKSWSSATRSISPSSIRQSPWLFSVDYSTDQVHLHDPWKTGIPKTYTFPIPINYKKMPYIIFGSAYGYLLVYEQFTVGFSLFNPLLAEGGSSSWFALPWFTLPELPSDEFGHGVGLLKPQLLKYGDDSYCVIINSDLTSKPFCWRSGDSSWTQLYDGRVKQFTFYKGSFWFVEYSCMIVIVDASNLNVTSRVPIPNVDEECPLYLVESSSGDLLIVAIDTDSTSQYQVMRVDLTQQPPVFVKVDSIGNDALFVTEFHSAVCFPATESKGFKRNCIYYYYDDRSDGQYHLYSLHIGDGSTIMEPCVLEKDACWLIPSISSI